MAKLNEPGWRGDDVSDRDFSRGFDEHFAPGLQDAWRKAFDSIEDGLANGDTKPKRFSLLAKNQASDSLATLLRLEYPPPKWVCKRLGAMISSQTEPNQGDRFVLYPRTVAAEGARLTRAKKLKAGADYQLARADGLAQTQAIEEVRAKRGYQKTYIDHGAAEFSKLPDYEKRKYAPDLETRLADRKRRRKSLHKFPI